MADKKVGVVDQIVAKVRELLAPLRDQVMQVQYGVTALESRVGHVERAVGDVKERVQKIPVPAPAIKLCKDCRFSVPFRGLAEGVAEKWDLATCTRPNPTNAKWLTGGGSGPYCANERGDYKDQCGLVGKYWEAR